ncbi:hypothetical protein RRG08_054231 [Elysia crispata]|uniref:Uncharacterized protein n=1 Tax=Elysia crispata TaxID=231223 RepID=A0AAE0YBT2_9GAST|nr:hypothetical protein RRG08_054231 [Elysia crispata]
MDLRYRPKTVQTRNSSAIQRPGEDPTDPSPDRPISLTSHKGKTLETIIIKSSIVIQTSIVHISKTLEPIINKSPIVIQSNIVFISLKHYPRNHHQQKLSFQASAELDQF